jgi:dinuclear metal center YbgI/SA1388 family protein
MKDVRSRNPRTMLIGQVIDAISNHAPLSAAEDWDNVGLLLGDPAQSVGKAVISVDLTFEAVKVAIKEKADLIVNHHPCIFPQGKGLSKVVAGTPVYEALRNGIAVAAYHTNFDRCALEVIQIISQGLGIEPQGRFQDSSSAQLIKLVTFVPLSHEDKVRQALAEAGAGKIGNYDFCTFGVKGEGTFRGEGKTKPFIGAPGKVEKVEEIRLETILPRGLEKKVLTALFAAHPYEEVAYDLYPVKQPALGKGLVRGLGYGFWGTFPQAKPFPEFAKDVKKLFNIHSFWVTEPAPSSIKRLGFVAGKGASFVESAVHLGCDLMMTGEAGYHHAINGAHNGTAVMELGHRESEKFFVETMKDWLLHLGLEVEAVQTPTQGVWQGGKR